MVFLSHCLKHRNKELVWNFTGCYASHFTSHSSNNFKCLLNISILYLFIYFWHTLSLHFFCLSCLTTAACVFWRILLKTSLLCSWPALPWVPPVFLKVITECILVHFNDPCKLYLIFYSFCAFCYCPRILISTYLSLAQFAIFRLPSCIVTCNPATEISSCISSSALALFVVVSLLWISEESSLLAHFPLHTDLVWISMLWVWWCLNSTGTEETTSVLRISFLHTPWIFSGTLIPS